MSPKATLSFSLPEESSEFQDCHAGPDWKAVVRAVLEHIRAELKYNSVPESKAAVLEEIRAVVMSELDERDLSVWG